MCLHTLGWELVLTHLDSVQTTTSAAKADQQVCLEPLPTAHASWPK